MLRCLLSSSVLFGVVLVAGAADAPAPLTKARKDYQDSVEKARTTLLDAFASAIKTSTSSGDLDAVKALKSEKEAFEAGGTLPTGAHVKAAARNYRLSMRQAGLVFERAADQVIKDLTKAGKLTEAQATQAELKEFRMRSPTTGARTTEVETKEDLQNYLPETVWDWGTGLKLRADGLLEQREWTANSLVTKWEAVDRRTIVLWVEKGRKSDRTAILTFNEDLTEFQGFGFDGGRLGVMKRKP